MQKFNTLNHYGAIKDFLVGPKNIILAKEECHCKSEIHWNLIVIRDRIELKLFTSYKESDLDIIMLKAKEELSFDVPSTSERDNPKRTDKKISNLARRLLVDH